jgi:hypothetical protein
MGILDFVNDLGQKFEKVALKEEFKAASIVRNTTNQNPILRKFNSLVDKWRGIIILLMFAWMLFMAYFIVFYDNSISLRTRAFVGADDFCALNSSANPNGYLLSNNMVGYCRNLSKENQQLGPAMFNQPFQCLNQTMAVINSCKCNKS